MTFRLPQSLSRSDTRSGVNVLEYELMAERADALGRHGLKVERAIAALDQLDSGKDGPAVRERLLDEAADAVWAFLIQREICGLRDSRDAVRRYGIPKEVMARLGIVRKR
ncbi:MULTISPECIES: DUF6665 family protein [unclassified Sinorhizobium]|uniref:DUF6665 family protein n=1 Tax=unclassified Sinorhizobium TaxID=2613772 RepID=UPI0024C46B95|nr:MULTISPECIES: DUF6665 family protein [unclassified Sinorhizobium]MDK1377548.1 hypothetical protein [Sinorhizobium sp. 6-70]MDK1479253.1 hypothetical protein [Sinorhizobium sp. 6-117]